MISFSITNIVIYTNSKKLSSNECQKFPENITKITLEKQLFKQWNWQYNTLELDGYIEQKMSNFNTRLSYAFK